LARESGKQIAQCVNAERGKLVQVCGLIYR